MKGKQLLSILILSVFIVATLNSVTGLALDYIAVNGIAVNGAKDTVFNFWLKVFNFWLNSGGVSSMGGSAKYASIDGPIGYTAGGLEALTITACIVYTP